MTFFSNESIKLGLYQNFLTLILDTYGAYIFDGLDNLDVGGENDDDWNYEAKTVDVRDVAHLKKKKKLVNIDK